MERIMGKLPSISVSALIFSLKGDHRLLLHFGTSQNEKKVPGESQRLSLPFKFTGSVNMEGWPCI